LYLPVVPEVSTIIIITWTRLTWALGATHDGLHVSADALQLRDIDGILGSRAMLNPRLHGGLVSNSGP
jgi:thiamine monophosphate synthase